MQNPDDRAFVLDLGVPPDNIVLIPGSGVDTDYFTPLPEPPPPVTAAYVGRMLADKGVFTLIDAMSRLLPDYQTKGNDNLADALTLMAMGTDLLGQPLVALPEKHRRALASVRSITDPPPRKAKSRKAA